MRQKKYFFQVQAKDAQEEFFKLVKIRFEKLFSKVRKKEEKLTHGVTHSKKQVSEVQKIENIA